jgi:fructose-1,6-bisphosphatase/sedoheptulose 1,7-bisphosphatase-like protein
MIETTDLSLDFLRVAEQAAIAGARTMGQGDRPSSDHAAAEARCAKMGIIHANCSDTVRVRF